MTNILKSKLLKAKAEKIKKGLLFPLVPLFLMGCHTDMWRQPKVTPYGESAAFQDGVGSRELPAGAVPQGKSSREGALYTGYKDGKLVTESPIEVTESLLKRGKEIYHIYCIHCHGLGHGDGMIAKRGLSLRRQPASFHTDRMRKMPIGYFIDVVNNGYGIMYPFADRIRKPEDKWAIAHYIRALQLSQNVKTDQISEKERKKLTSFISDQGSGDKSLNDPQASKNSHEHDHEGVSGVR